MTAFSHLTSAPSARARVSTRARSRVIAVLVGALVAPLLTVTTIPPVEANQPSCPDGWTRVYMTGSGDNANDIKVRNALDLHEGLCVEIGVEYFELATVNTSVTTDNYDVIYLQGQNNWSPSFQNQFGDNDMKVVEDFIASGGGLVVGEWHAWNICNRPSNTAFQKLDALMPITIRSILWGCDYGSNKDVRFFRTDSDGNPFRPISAAIDDGVANEFVFEPFDAAGSLSFVDAKPDATVFFYATWVGKGGDVPAATLPSLLPANGGVGMAGWAPTNKGRVFAFSTTNGAPELCPPTTIPDPTNNVDWRDYGCANADGSDRTEQNSFRRLVINALTWSGSVGGSINPEVVRVSTANDGDTATPTFSTARLNNVTYSYQVVGGDPLPATVANSFDTTTGTFTNLAGTNITTEVRVTATGQPTTTTPQTVTLQNAPAPREVSARVLMTPGEAAVGFQVANPATPTGSTPPPSGSTPPAVTLAPVVLDNTPGRELPRTGNGTALVSGTPTTITVAPVVPTLPQGNAGTATPTAIALRGETPSGSYEITLEPAVDLNDRGRGSVRDTQLQLVHGEGLKTQISGFQPNSRAHIYLFSEPQLLGEYAIDSNGNLTATVELLPTNIDACAHTVQVVGVLPNGEKLAASLGVWVLPAQSAFADTPLSATHSREVNCLFDLAAASGFTAHRFGVNAPITRGQAASMLARLRGLADAPSPFADAQHTHSAKIGALAQAGVLHGATDGLFHPGRRLTRGEAASIIARAIGYDVDVRLAAVNFVDHADAGVHAPAVNLLSEQGIVAGFADGTFRANQPVTRGEFATMLVRARTVFDTAN